MLETFSYVIGLVEHSRRTTDRFDEHRTGLDHVAFHVPDVTDLDMWAEHRHSLSIEHSGIKMTTHASVITLRDPDGIQLELYWPNREFWAERFIAFVRARPVGRAPFIRNALARPVRQAALPGDTELEELRK